MRALILGVTGQDGSYLAEQLTHLGYEVWGMVRGQPDAHPRYQWLRELVPSLRLVGGDLLDAGSLRDVVRAYPAGDFDEIYNLAAISTPMQAWAQPVLTGDVTGLGVTRLLDAIYTHQPQARVVQAGSIATHGPYGAAKAYAHTICRDYRDRGLHVSVALFGGHHSPRRTPAFFSRKVTQAAALMSRGVRKEKLRLGPLGRRQDWGWASDFVTALPLIAAREPSDYVISTGQQHSCEDWVLTAFSAVGLDWADCVESDPAAGNPADVSVLSAAPDHRLTHVWQPRQDFVGLVWEMVKADL